MENESAGAAHSGGIAPAATACYPQKVHPRRESVHRVVPWQADAWVGRCTKSTKKTTKKPTCGLRGPLLHGSTSGSVGREAHPPGSDMLYVVMSCDAARFPESSVSATGWLQELTIAHTVHATSDDVEDAADAEEKEDARMHGAADGASLPCTSHCTRAHATTVIRVVDKTKVMPSTVKVTCTGHTPGSYRASPALVGILHSFSPASSLTPSARERRDETLAVLCQRPEQGPACSDRHSSSTSSVRIVSPAVSTAATVPRSQRYNTRLTAVKASGN
jgi:hypothetical protein